MIDLSVAQEFSRAPGGRFRSMGPDSAEEFLEELLEPRFKEAVAAGKALRVDLDGGYGYAASFLDEAFGGLARKHGSEKVGKHIEIKSEEEPYLRGDVLRYIRESGEVTPTNPLTDA